MVAAEWDCTQELRHRQTHRSRPTRDPTEAVVPERHDGRAMSSALGDTEGSALFERDGTTYLPTPLARGPWRPDALHGGAVAALLASAIDLPGRTVARVTFDLLAPVPNAALRLVAEPSEGGRRVARQSIALVAGDEVVAHAACVGVRQRELDLPVAAAEPNPLADVDLPDLTQRRPSIADLVGWTCFDSAAVSVRTLRLPSAPPRSAGVFVNLLVPVVAGERTSPIARAAAAADYASSATDAHLPFDQWSFMNAELTLHMSRPPASPWIALLSTALIQPIGCGVSTALLFDADGRVGQAAQTLVVESRRRSGTH